MRSLREYRCNLVEWNRVVKEIKTKEMNTRGFSILT